MKSDKRSAIDSNFDNITKYTRHISDHAVTEDGKIALGTEEGNVTVLALKENENHLNASVCDVEIESQDF